MKRMELEVATFDLPLAIDNARTFVRERATKHGINLDVTVDERLGDFVGDERKIKQILLNLLSNAVKSPPEGGRIGIIARQVDGGKSQSVTPASALRQRTSQRSSRNFVRWAPTIHTRSRGPDLD
jgi:signal transduction histidine kinase